MAKSSHSVRLVVWREEEEKNYERGAERPYIDPRTRHECMVFAGNARKFNKFLPGRY